MIFIKYYSIIFAMTFCSWAFINSVNCQLKDLGFGFPEVEADDASKRNSQNKKPVYIPTRCAENELLYPGDYKDDWVCDCKPGHIYYPMSDRCHSAYRRGPCASNEYLILPKTKVIPECQRNPCSIDGFVPYRNACHQLHRAGPCPFPELSYVIGINDTSLEIQCLRASESTMNNSDILASRFGDDETTTTTTTTTEIPFDNTVFGSGCYLGSKRAIDGKCPEDNV